MTADDILAAVYMLNRGTAERARRLACAVALMRAGMTRRAAVAQIRARFVVCHSEAWRMVDMASDVAGKDNAP